MKVTLRGESLQVPDSAPLLLRVCPLTNISETISPTSVRSTWNSLHMGSHAQQLQMPACMLACVHAAMHASAQACWRSPVKSRRLASPRRTSSCSACTGSQSSDPPSRPCRPSCRNTTHRSARTTSLPGGIPSLAGAAPAAHVPCTAGRHECFCSGTILQTHPKVCGCRACYLHVHFKLHF